MSGGWGLFFLVFGLVVLVFTIGRMLRRRGAGRLSDGPPRPLGERSQRGSPGHEESLRELDRHVERRIHTLEALIEEADERIRRLSDVSSGPGDDGEDGKDPG